MLWNLISVPINPKRSDCVPADALSFITLISSAAFLNTNFTQERKIKLFNVLFLAHTIIKSLRIISSVLIDLVELHKKNYKKAASGCSQPFCLKLPLR